MESTQNNSKVIDITGVSAIGKSTWLNKNCNDKAITYKARGSSPTVTTSILLHLRLLMFCSFNNYLSFSDIFWLLKKSSTLKDSLKVRLNVFRNCLLKFLVQKEARCFSETVDNDIIYIDEGISHIPFLLQNQASNPQLVFNEFYLRFSNNLADLNIVCLEGNVDTFARLKTRGHKRLINGTDKEINNFIKMNYNTLSNLIENSCYFATFNLIKVNN